MTERSGPHGDLLPLRVPGWDAIPNLVHGFCGRAGGVSVGALASLNLSSAVGDDPHRVAENWRRVDRAFRGLAFIRTRQVHGGRVVRVDDADRGVEEDADGMIACGAGRGLAILTADCVPILCVAPRERAVMALHAGWRGTVAGIAAAGLEAGEQMGIAPSAWQVAFGPSIGGCCYEVESEIGQTLIDRWGSMPDAWQSGGRRGQLDLRAANQQILLELGVPAAQIATVGPCTACRQDEYFSHRASAGRAGRQISAIGWAGR